MAKASASEEANNRGGVFDQNSSRIERKMSGLSASISKREVSRSTLTIIEARNSQARRLMTATPGSVASSRATSSLGTRPMTSEPSALSQTKDEASSPGRESAFHARWTRT